MSRAPKIPVSVLVVIHQADGQVLLIERADQPGYWQSVTGSLDAEDEALEATARREVAEETGITGGTLVDWQLSNVYEIYPVWRHRYAPGVTHNTEHVFGLTVPAGTARLRITLSASHTAADVARLLDAIARAMPRLHKEAA